MPRRPRHDRRRPPRHDAFEAPPPALGQGRDVWVELAGHTVRLAELRAHPGRYARWFAAARRHPGHARCRCSRRGERLVIRRVAGRYHLARWPQSGDNHRPGCPFFTSESAHSGAGPARAAITVAEHGTRIAVNYDFTTALPGHPDAPADTEDPDQSAGPDDPVAELASGARPTTATVSGLGLLHWLWETGGLNTWPPTHGGDQGQQRAPRRRWHDVHTTLLPVLAGLRLGEHPAPTLCHVIAPYRPGRPDPAREARLAQFLEPLEHPEHVVIRGGPRRGQHRQLRRRRLLLGELKDLTATAHGHKLTLRHFPRPVFLTGEQHTDLTRRYPAALAAGHPASARVVLLALIEGSAHGYLRLVDAAAMLVSEHYIPADSQHELTMAAALVAAGREFIKPVRYDRDDAVFPGFVLTDTEPPTVVEVWGITGRADYENRKRAKRAHYTSADVALLEWSPPAPLPDLQLR